MKLNFTVYAEFGEQLNIFRLGKAGQNVNSGIKVGQTALLSFFFPLVTVTVAVEDDPLVLLDGLYKQIMQRGIEIGYALQLVCELLKRVCDYRVEYGIRTSNVEVRSHHSELELVARKRKRRSSVAVGGILGEIGER